MKHGHKQINNLVHFSTNIHNDTRKLNINGIFTICMIDSHHFVCYIFKKMKMLLDNF